MTISQSELYRKAADLIDAGWCKEMAAQDENGEFVGAFSDKACKFCMTGAIARIADAYGCQIYSSNIYSVNELSAFNAALGYIDEEKSVYTSMPFYNDNVAENAEEVSSTLRKMAEYVEAREYNADQTI